MLAFERLKSSGKCVGHVFEVTRSDISSTTVERSSEVRGVCGVEGPFLFKRITLVTVFILYFYLI